MRTARHQRHFAAIRVPTGVLITQTEGVEPSREYFTKIGELAYRVSQIEWLIIDDIRLASTSIDAHALHGLPTGAIGRALEDLIPELAKRPNVQHFVATASKALLNVARRRNTVLHARPGTTRSGDVRLVKLNASNDGTVDDVWIDDDFLDKQLAAVRYWLGRVDRARELPLD